MSAFVLIAIVWVLGTLPATALFKMLLGSCPTDEEIEQADEAQAYVLCSRALRRVFLVIFWSITVPGIVLVRSLVIYSIIDQITPTFDEIKQKIQKENYEKKRRSEILSGPPTDLLADQFSEEINCQK